ncbi:MAG: hypothetical protein ACYC36_02415 [Bellilinea sp.]
MALPQDIREEEEMLLRKMRAGINDASIIAMNKLLELRVRKCQDRMLTCQPAEFPEIQAEAQTLIKLLRDLKQK